MKRVWVMFSVVLVYVSVFVHAQDIDTVGREPVYVDETEYRSILYEDSVGSADETHTLMPPDSLNTTRNYLGQKVPLKEFDDEKWKRVVGDVDFKEESVEMSRSGGSLPQLPWAGPLLRAIFYIVIIGVVLTLIYFVVKNFAFDLKIQKAQVDEDDPDKPVDNIESLDIRAMLEKAISEGNYRLAVRLYYLGLLKRLNEMGMIAWKKDKTNRDYLGELFQRNFLFDEIRKLTFSYESVWYGEHELKPESYVELTTRFETTYQKLSNDEG